MNVVICVSLNNKKMNEQLKSSVGAHKRQVTVKDPPGQRGPRGGKQEKWKRADSEGRRGRVEMTVRDFHVDNPVRSWHHIVPPAPMGVSLERRERRASPEPCGMWSHTIRSNSKKSSCLPGPHARLGVEMGADREAPPAPYDPREVPATISDSMPGGNEEQLAGAAGVTEKSEACELQV